MNLEDFIYYQGLWCTDPCIWLFPLASNNCDCPNLFPDSLMEVEEMIQQVYRLFYNDLDLWAGFHNLSWGKVVMDWTLKWLENTTYLTVI